MLFCFAKPRVARTAGSLKGTPPLKKPHGGGRIVNTLVTAFFMPRPRKSKATKRRHNYSVWLSDLELDWLRMKAIDAGVPASVFIRCSTLGKPIPRRISKISLKTYQELSRIGNNLNQLTKASNAAIKMGCQPPVDLEILNELLEAVNQVGRQLTNLIDCDEESEELEEESGDDWEAEEG